MDKTAPIGKRQIFEQQLPPHLQFGLSVKGSTVHSSSSVIARSTQIIAGEAITSGWAVAIKESDRKLYHASIKVVDELPAVGIAQNSGDADELITVLFHNWQSVEGVVFTIGNPVWLCSPQLTSPNITTVLPTQTSGYWCQRVGQALEENKFVVSIQTARAIP